MLLVQFFFASICIELISQIDVVNCANTDRLPMRFMTFQVCDEPHPLLIKDMIQSCVGGDLDGAYRIMSHLWSLGYAPEDIIGIVFRVCKTHPMAEYLKLEFIKVHCQEQSFLALF